MGRKREKDLNLPPRMRRKGQYFYYDAGGKPRKWIPLGRDYALAVKRWAEHEGANAIVTAKPTFDQVSVRYEREVIPQKAVRTQKDNLKELPVLHQFFAGAPLDEITPQHVRQFLDWRGATAKIRANREIALFSHIFNMARDWGYTAAANPCQGVKRFKEQGRDRYVNDGEFLAVYEKADSVVQDAMDLYLLTGQRVSDVLKLTRSDIRDGRLWICQGKTKKRLRIEITGELKTVIDRALARPSEVGSMYIIHDEKGQRLTYDRLFNRFEKARTAARVWFQLRDLRAKTATDTEDLGHAQKLLGHESRAMTEHYTKQRAGEIVKPLK